MIWNPAIDPNLITGGTVQIAPERVCRNAEFDPEGFAGLRDRSFIAG